jgi:hypothetical protein
MEGDSLPKVTPETRVVRQTAALLRRVCPLAGPVRVTICDLSARNLHGQAVVTEHGAQYVRIAAGLSLDTLRDALIHEWAHLRAWDLHGLEIADHGEEWGRVYAAVYSAWCTGAC